MAKIKPTHAAVFIVVLLKDAHFLDMLRYDNCLPASEVEASRMETVMREGAPQWVVLRRFVPMPGGNATPTVDRWQSFGVRCDSQTYENYHDARRQADTYPTTGFVTKS